MFKGSVIKESQFSVFEASLDPQNHSCEMDALEFWALIVTSIFIICFTFCTTELGNERRNRMKLTRQIYIF